MKQFVLMILTILIISCNNKKDDPQPSTLPTGGNTNGGGGGSTTPNKTVHFYSHTASINKTTYAVYLYANQSDKGKTDYQYVLGSAMELTNNTSGCFSTSFVTKNFTGAGKYYYQIKKAGASTQILFEGDIDIDATGAITVTETLTPTDDHINYENCTATKGSFSIEY
jgi:hypothetical protein